MSFEGEDKAVEQRFAAGFTAAPVAYENVNFDNSTVDEFVELRIHNSTTVRASIGDDALHRTYGVITARCYVKKNTGTYRAKALADLAAVVFRDAQFSNITCRSPNIMAVGEMNEWYVHLMTVDFFRDENF